jgi:hypothetical protein
MAAKKTTKTPKKPTDPASDKALLALDPSYAAPPDMPVDVAAAEMASLARLAKTKHGALAKIGIGAAKIAALAAFAKRLGALQKGWLGARGKVKLSAEERALLTEAEALDQKLLAGGRWACRKDKDAQDELSRISEGSGLADTVADLRDLVTFWAAHEADLKKTDITDKDLKRAKALAAKLEDAAAHEGDDVDAAQAQELRNRAFWAGDELSKEIREGGRYAFRGEPKLAAKFVSRYRSSVARKSKQKAQANRPSKASKPAEAAAKTDGAAPAAASAKDAKPATSGA